MKAIAWRTIQTKQEACEVSDIHDRVLRFSGGIIEVEVAPGERIQIEMFQRGAADAGIRIRTLDSNLDVRPEVSNCVSVVPRGAR